MRLDDESALRRVVENSVGRQVSDDEWDRSLWESDCPVAGPYDELHVKSICRALAQMPVRRDTKRQATGAKRPTAVENARQFIEETRALLVKAVILADEELVALLQGFRSEQFGAASPPFAGDSEAAREWLVAKSEEQYETIGYTALPGGVRHLHEYRGDPLAWEDACPTVWAWSDIVVRYKKVSWLNDDATEYGCVPSSGVEAWPFRERRSCPVLIVRRQLKPCPYCPLLPCLSCSSTPR